MATDAQCRIESHGPMKPSPRSLAKKIESCIVRNALDEERRAHKALFLLKARDRRIAYLEKRVAELEDTAADIHEISLLASSRMSIAEDRDITSEETPSERSTKMEDDDRSIDLTNSDTPGDIEEKIYEDNGHPENRPPVPCLRLSKSSASNSEKDIFSTPAVEPNCDFLRNEVSERREKIEEKDDDGNEEITVRSDNVIQGPPADLKIDDRSDRENNVNKRNGSSASVGNNERIRVIFHGKQQKSNFPAKISSSVPWIGAKSSPRRKICGFDLKMETQGERGLCGDSVRQPTSGFGTIGIASQDRQREKREIIDGAKKVESTVAREEDKAFVDAQEARFIAVEKTNAESKTTSTQTLTTIVYSAEQVTTNSEIKNVNSSSSSCAFLGQKSSSSFWSVDEDPAPQWLIEEALNRGTEVCKEERWTRKEDRTNKPAEYESIISELEAKLIRTKADLVEAVNSKSMLKEKYKRNLEDLKAEARGENEVLQERIVRICTSVLENFGPRAIIEKKGHNYQIRSHRRLRCHEKVSNVLHKKLRAAVTKSKRLKRELISTSKALNEKSAKYDSMNKCFSRLKQEMETTEINLNNLIAENVSLRKRIEETREWMEFKMGKDQHEKNNTVHFRDMQRCRELTNLKKKAEEDFARITQLRNKLLRSESANANKGFLLNSYKSQLTDLNKEKEELISKMNGLQTELNVARNNNLQLKAKVSFLNNEKLSCDSEKSKTDITEKVEELYAKKCEESIQREIDAIRAKYEETIKVMETKLNIAESQTTDYSTAIQEFLKKLHDYYADREMEKNLSGSEVSEKEACETACNILNMTPVELSGFIKGKTPMLVNSWLMELNRITSKSNFSKRLSKFLLKKAVKQVKI